MQESATFVCAVANSPEQRHGILHRSLSVVCADGYPTEPEIKWIQACAATIGAPEDELRAVMSLFIGREDSTGTEGPTGYIAVDTSANERAGELLHEGESVFCTWCGTLNGLPGSSKMSSCRCEWCRAYLLLTSQQVAVTKQYNHIFWAARAGDQGVSLRATTNR